MHIVALAGGVGGAKFLRGLLAAAPQARLTVIGNVGDDITLHGLRICPDLDTVMYTLGGGIHPQQGWGRAGEVFTVAEELAAYGVGPDWFTLGDRDIATHLVRTRMLDAGYPLSSVTEALCVRWSSAPVAEAESADGSPAETVPTELARITLLPATDDRAETHVVPRPGPDGRRQAVHFQEYWVRLHAPDAESVVFLGADAAKPAPGVLEAIESADVVILPPSNPVVSIGAILAVPGIREALVASAAPVVGVSPIIGAAPVRGMADKVLAAVGVQTDPAAVAEYHGADLLDGWLIADSDAALLGRVTEAGIACRAVPLMMTDLAATTEMARQALDLADELARR
ncbi:MAG TPA: 2-phospho-L-lactate transferase [Actinocrinis sp.]|nr:2-phospho-L-lactate transferase [Actinocrinis sp.]